MYKLVILFMQPVVRANFDQGWQKFLSLVEQMPGLKKEAVADVEQIVFGPSFCNFKKIHELYFDSRESLEEALASEAGQQAGQWLHSFTQGKFASLVVRHMEATPDQFKRQVKGPARSP
jgi:uncharacterized protein (TIGR02118 family)